MSPLLNSFLIVLLIIFSFPVRGQFAEKKHNYYLDHSLALHVTENGLSKYQVVNTRPPGERMMKVGEGLTLGGGFLLLVGAVVAGSTNFANITNADNTINWPVYYQALAGVALIETGVGMLIPGIIFWTRGSGKLKRYKEQNLSLGIRGNGLSLRLKL